ncbi:T9SS type A sorting domain-containing protein [Flavobacterium sp.]|uniref:T9SS type A sorting domain-containing protein n=1 Tax=Flavobacterium sp. TaxID=239 RepID=UPI00260D8F83|nr:T9SS type A sorting domain-containing protein [Flavobacterium sp.]
MRLIYILLLLCNFTVFGQAFQWGKRGGSTDSFSNGGEFGYDVITDSQRNIYVLSKVGIHNLDVDGNVKQGFGDPTSITDVMLASFSCDGNYRWSKVIGGSSPERKIRIQVDANDNIYVAGRFSSCDGLDQYPSRIDNDVILDQNNSACSLMFLAKFNSAGVMQWFKRPQPLVNVTASYGQSGIEGVSTDIDGNTDLLLLIPPGTYADGAFTATEPGSHYYIFKYDTDGNFLQAFPIDIQHAIDVDPGLKMFINRNNGHYYFTGERDDDTDVITVGGSPVSNGFYLFSFDQNGQFLWKRESIGSAAYFTAYNLAFDNQDNIYMAGQIVGFNSVSFLGFSSSVNEVPQYVMKMNPNADTLIWASGSNRSVDTRGAMALNGNEVAVTAYAGLTWSWGSQSIVINNLNQGTRTSLARFNATTGECLHLDYIPSDFGGVNCGTSITVDASGDYIIGGALTGTQTYATNSTSLVGGQSDFFVTKYATAVCSPLKVDRLETTGLQFYPNPVKSVLTLEIANNMSYELIDISGKRVLKGTVTKDNPDISMAGVSIGNYILRLKDANGIVKIVKLVKE